MLQSKGKIGREGKIGYFSELFFTVLEIHRFEISCRGGGKRIDEKRAERLERRVRLLCPERHLFTPSTIYSENDERSDERSTSNLLQSIRQSSIFLRENSRKEESRDTSLPEVPDPIDNGPAGELSAIFLSPLHHPLSHTLFILKLFPMCEMNH